VKQAVRPARGLLGEKNDALRYSTGKKRF